jgi:hypothetical protein
LVGDRIGAATGPAALVRVGGLLAAGGLGVALLLDRPVAGVVGFGLLGAGLSCVAPQIFAVAGAAGGTAGRTLARVVSLGYLGFLTGPIVIGAVASGVGLPRALLVPVALASVVAAGAGVLRR